MKYIFTLAFILSYLFTSSQSLYLTDQENYEHYLKLGGKSVAEVEFALMTAKNKLGEQFSSRTQIGVDQSKNYSVGNHADIGCNDTSAIDIDYLPKFYLHEKISNASAKQFSNIASTGAKKLSKDINKKAIKDCSPKLNIAMPSMADMILFKQFQHMMENIEHSLHDNNNEEDDKKEEEEEGDEDEDEDEDEEESTITITHKNYQPIIHLSYQYATKLKDVFSNEEGIIKVNLSNLKKYLDLVDKNMEGFWLIHENKTKVHTYYIALK